VVQCVAMSCSVLQCAADVVVKFACDIRACDLICVAVFAL